MRCILHVGTEKTATTTIQEFLHINRKALSRVNYLYTKSAGNRNNQWLALSAYDAHRRDNLTVHRGIDTDQQLLNFQTRTIEKLQKEINQARPFKVAVFSSELIQSRLRSSEELLRLKKILNQLGFDDIQILIYLRRPVDTVSSLYSTAIKCGSVDDSPPSPNHQYYRNVCHHQQTLQRFGNVFGEDAIKPRLFAKDEFKGGSVISDFLDAIDLADMGASFNLPMRQNERLSAVGIEILRRINQQIPTAVDNRPNLFRTGLMENFADHFKEGPSYCMPEELFWQYETEFEEGNEWVRAKYFPEKARLFPEASYPNKANIDLAQTDLDNVANLLTNMWLEKQRTPSASFSRLKGRFKLWVKCNLL